MGNPWDPDHAVPLDLARRLIESTHPALAPVRVAPLGEGWDNVAYRVNGTLVFRFPRRTTAAELIETEARVLPRLAPRLPVRVPEPRWIGRDQAHYPWTFVGYLFLPGRPVIDQAQAPAARGRLVPALAGVLRALHAIPVADAQGWGAGPDTLRRLDVAHQRDAILPALAALHARGVIADVAPYVRIIDEASTHELAGEVLVHGDLHADHVLVDDDGGVSAVIDWGDLHCNHPAADLRLGWLLLPPRAREAFFDAYGGVDTATLAHARLRALRAGAALEAHAAERGDRVRMAEAQRALRWLLVE